MVEEISIQEVALYDRQIRLWGMDAQTKMRATHVLVVGLNGLSNEVIKNLVLAGIGSLTILSDATFNSFSPSVFLHSIMQLSFIQKVVLTCCTMDK
jgi:tRNA A37 threonylcarbamoyladenosine dehydratase